MKRPHIVLTPARIEALADMVPTLHPVLRSTMRWRGGKAPGQYREALIRVALAVREGRCLPRRSA